MLTINTPQARDNSSVSDVLYDLQATHTRRSPVFVVGCARSGTSVTCRMLRRYLKVSFGTESQFILRYNRRLGDYGDLHDDRNVRRLIEDISRERFFVRSRRNWGFVFNPARACASLHGRTYSDVLHTIFHQLAEHNGMVRWGDKTPQYNEDLGALQELFPDAQFIHVVRDGRDVALSIQRTNFGAKNACEAAADWSRAIHAIDAFSHRVPPDRFFELRYEHLISRPADTMVALAGFLGIDDADGALETFIRTNIGKDIRQNNAGKWRRGLPARDVERFEGIAGDTLARTGYELAFKGLARPVSARERAYWRLRGRAARLVRTGYWKDNAYKLALRLRRRLPPVLRGTNASAQQDAI